MRLIAAAFLILPLTSATAAEKPAPAPKAVPRQCDAPAGAATTGKLGPLASMPNATELKPLYRTENGCTAPLVNRSGRGSDQSAETDQPALPFTLRPARR